MVWMMRGRRRGNYGQHRVSVNSRQPLFFTMTMSAVCALNSSYDLPAMHPLECVIELKVRIDAGSLQCVCHTHDGNLLVSLVRRER